MQLFSPSPHPLTPVNVDLHPTTLYSNFVMLRSTLGRPAPPVTLGGPTKKYDRIPNLRGNKNLQKQIPDGLKWKSWFLQKMTVWLQKYNTKSTFLRKPNEERIMSRSFLSYQVDFRTPYKSQILIKSRKKKIGRNNILAINPLLLSRASGEHR